MLHDCDLCGNSDKFLPLPGDPSGKISICGSCGFVLVRERRSVEEIALSWSEIYRNKGYDPEWPGVKARLFYVAEWLDQTIGLRNKSVLDIGAGNGQFLAYCADRGATPVGLDPDIGNVAKIAARGFGNADWHASDNSPGFPVPFDIVTLNWTLENTGDALEVLRYAKRCLAPGGHVVVATGSRFEGFKKPLSHYLPQDRNYPHDTHCFRWSYITLQKLFWKVGIIPGKTNDWRDRDEMIIAGPACEPWEDYIKDIPDIVEDHFLRWKTCFP